jgi:hypothetical protein
MSSPNKSVPKRSAELFSSLGSIAGQFAVDISVQISKCVV